MLNLRKIGESFLLPVSILPVAGLLLGLGGALSNPVTISSYPILNNNMIQIVFILMKTAGNTVFQNLPLMMTIGLCANLTEGDKSVSILAGVISYLVMNGTITALSYDKAVIEVGVLGGITIGIITAKLQTKYRHIILPDILSYFGGDRFVLIIATLTSIAIGIIFYFVWPGFQNVLTIIGSSLSSLGYLGTFLYGFLMRMSGSVGLHHILYPMFWFTEMGGVEMVAGAPIAGAQNIFFAQLANPAHTGLYSESARYFSGRYATMMFGLPASCLAMYLSIDKANRSQYQGLFMSAALTSFITGITQPIEYMFLFVSPFLYLIHSLLDGLSFFLAQFVKISIGSTYSGGAIDFLLFGVLQGSSKTNWIRLIPIGIIMFAVYYFVFKFIIKKFNILTPGRGDITD